MTSPSLPPVLFKQEDLNHCETGRLQNARRSCVSLTGLTEGTTAAESGVDDLNESTCDGLDRHLLQSRRMSTVFEPLGGISEDGIIGCTIFPSDIAKEVREEFPCVTQPLPHPLGCALKNQDVLVGADLSPDVREFSDLTDPDVIVSICRKLVPGWNEVSPDGLVVSKILAGLTNQLFSVSVKESYWEAFLTGVLGGCAKKKPTGRVLFRIYGKDVGDLYDSKMEVQVYKTLARKGIAPQLLGEFEGGRIEEWIEGNTLAVQDARRDRILVAVAKILGKFHKLQPESLPKHLCREPASLSHLRRWNSYVRLLLKSHAEDHPLFRKLSSLSIEKLLHEADALQDLLVPSTCPPTSATNIVFGHNDVQENNIMCVAGGLRLIDFEYSAFNYAGFDIANFFVECTIDYTHPDYPYYSIDETAYPCRASRRLFAAVYLSEVLDRPVSPNHLELIRPFLAGVERMALASHLVWGFWSIIRAPQAPTFEDFDYLEYAADRFKLYWKQKEYLEATGALGGLSGATLHEPMSVSDEDQLWITEWSGS